jgi:lysophospholipase L1-like esterase
MVSGTTGTAIMSVSSIQDRGLIDFNDARYPIYHASNTLGAYDGSTSATGPSWGDNTFVHKVAGSWSSATGKFRWVMDGGTAATANFDGDMDIGSTIYFGRRGSGTASAIGGHLKGVYLYNRVLSDAEKQILTGKCHTDYVSVAPDGVSCPSYPSNSITCWGDSLTAAEDVGYPQWLNWEFGNSRMVVNQGVSSETSTDVLARINATTNHRSSVAVFWMGNNNYSDPDTVLADIASAVFTLSTSRYVILGLVNGDYADRVAGQPGYDNIVAINTALAASYPDNYVDIRSYLIDNYDPTNATDVNDHDVKDCLPSSIRVDEIHLTEYGYSLVARRVRQFIKAKGW